jgi:hypothetical protein
MAYRARLTHVLAILTSALVSTWPALLNRYPLLYADSLSYLGEGRAIAQQFLHRTGNFIGMRSEFYSLFIFFVHWGRSPWTVVALHALLTAYIVWLVIRATLPQYTTSRFLALTIILSVLTTMSWYVSLIMPDILGPLLYLCLCLLCFAPETLSRFEHIAVGIFAWWAIVSHATHLVMALWILAVLTLLLICRSRIMQRRTRALSEVAVIIAIATASQCMLHAYLYGHPSLNGNQLPYLTARFLADGPERTYLQTRCATEHWLLCAHVDNLPDNDDEFIWGDNTIWTTATPVEKQRILKEETPLILATLRTYPRQQLAISFGSFLDQLNDFGVNDFDNNTWIEDSIEETMRGAHARYERSLQAHDRVPTNFFTTLQRWPVYASVIIIVAFLPWLWRRRETQLLGFLAVILPMLIANAFITAVASEVDSRFQARVIWLLPLLAGIIFFRWKDSRSVAAS